MAHFAKVQDNRVLSVIVADQAFVDQYVDHIPGEWIQTSYNTKAGEHRKGGTPLRYNYASKGGFYDKDADAFYGPKPFPSWKLNKKTYTWEAPKPMPEDPKGLGHIWDEENGDWVMLSE